MVELPFGLRRRPFPTTPDHTCYYPATSHERALARLLRGLADGEGMLLLTGTPGTGKTLLCHCLLDRLGSEVWSAFLTNSHGSACAGLLQSILYDLSLPHEDRSEQQMRLALTDHLLKAYAAGRRTILLIDEAQHLSPDQLEELRLLGNLEARSGKAVQIVLIGQPDVLQTLAGPKLAALRQRLLVRASLDPLDLQEAADYVLHHLRAAGGRPERIIDDEALELIARSTKGVPRLINQAGHQALSLAAEAGAATVDVEVVLEALGLLGLSGEQQEADAPTGHEDAEVILAGPPAAQETPSEEVKADPACKLFVTRNRFG
jgi:type II secretory pathway predicted ATPase ExeA